MAQKKCVALDYFVEQRFKYVELMQTCIAPIGSVRHEQLLASAYGGILQAVGAAKDIKPDVAMSIQARLSSAFQPAQIETIMAAINSKGNLGSGSAPDGQETRQENNFLDGYLME